MEIDKNIAFACPIARRSRRLLSRQLCHCVGLPRCIELLPGNCSLRCLVLVPASALAFSSSDEARRETRLWPRCAFFFLFSFIHLRRRRRRRRPSRFLSLFISNGRGSFCVSLLFSLSFARVCAAAVDGPRVSDTPWSSLPLRSGGKRSLGNSREPRPSVCGTTTVCGSLCAPAPLGVHHLVPRTILTLSFYTFFSLWKAETAPRPSARGQQWP